MLFIGIYLPFNNYTEIYQTFVSEITCKIFPYYYNPHSNFLVILV
jgi:hypothetical protein